MKTWWRLGLVAGICASSSWAVDWKALKPQGSVSDFAGVSDPGTNAEINQYCRRVEAATGVRIFLVTLATLENEPIDEVGPAIFQAWNGNRNPDQQVLLILAVGERRHWVGGGPGVPSAVVSGIDGKILRETHPAFLERDYREALKAAAEAMGTYATRDHHVPDVAPLSRRLRPTLVKSIPWIVLGGAAIVLLWLLFRGNPAGYESQGHRGLLTAWLFRNSVRHSSWGSRGSGGFGGYDSGDASGGFGGGTCRDW